MNMSEECDSIPADPSLSTRADAGQDVTTTAATADVANETATTKTDKTVLETVAAATTTTDKNNLESSATTTSDKKAAAESSTTTTTTEKSDGATSATTDQTAAQVHYNAVPEKGIQERTKSRIFYLRNFNNWVKSQLLGDVFNRLAMEWRDNLGRSELSILDLCCGKGGDILKYKKAREQQMMRSKRLRVGHVVFSDIAEVSLQQAESRFKESRTRERYADNHFGAEFIHADATRVELSEKLQRQDQQFDLCSQQFSLHYGFESEAQARQMLRNAVGRLRVGGYYAATIPHYARIVSLARDPKWAGTFSNEVCSVAIQNAELLADPTKSPALFGETYHFRLEEQVDCPEYLVYFPLLQQLLAELDMQLVWCKPFDQMLSDYGGSGEGRDLLKRMSALEPYPPDDGQTLMGVNVEQEYAGIAAEWEQLKAERGAGDSNPGKIGSLSESEWQVACLYLAFVFKKVEPMQQ